jgi:hypothetical protein
MDSGDFAGNIASFTDRHLEEIAYGLAAILYGEHFFGVTIAVASIALDPDIGQEVHLNSNLPIAFAFFAPTAGDIETEVARVQASDFGFRQFGIKLSYVFKNTGVGGWVARRRIA